ncbi:MAG: Spy/CpxP family protein refolding chaperone [Betaproteobacteria bacterium]
MKKQALVVAMCIAAFTSSHASQQSAYVGQESRDIKALSQQEIDGILAGKGMGFAKAAELNGYPGPAHVLELADKLELSPEQRAQTRTIFERMESSAKSLGAQLIEAERSLELLFRSRTIEPASLRAAVERIAGLQAQVRVAHLQAHLQQTNVLTAAQAATYSKLRGYGTPGSGQTGHAHKHQ